MSNGVDIALDSLPYYDQDLDRFPQLRAQINSQIALELLQLLPKTATVTPTNLPSHLATPRPLPTNQTFLAAELKRVEAGKPVPANVGLDRTRYDMKAPVGAASKSLEAWEAAHNSSLAQLEHAHLRNLNGSLLQSLGSNHWRLQNFTLESTVATLEAESAELKLEVEEVNRERKRVQEAGGVVLSRMETRWTELVGTGIQVEIGCMALEGEIMQLRAREAEVKARLGQMA